MRRAAAALAFIDLVNLLTGSVPAQAAAGDLDPDWNGSGDSQKTIASGKAVAIGTDGSLSSFATRRWLPTGRSS